ncbi:MAG TPA: hypothetical protein VNH11_21545 [Pirellulales bacterium]|nr:hypothetical protein [Pirellulales bacterium]
MKSLIGCLLFARLSWVAAFEAEDGWARFDTAGWGPESGPGTKF